MKITKKLLCMALSVIMLASCLSTAVFADGATKFSDVNAGEIYSGAVSTLNLMGVINGYEDGTFKPDQNVTRAEFTAMLMRTLNYGSTGSTSAAELPFTDIDDNNSDINWSIPNINTAYAMGIINGYEDSTFRPTANVAFEEAVKMIVCTLGYGNNVDVSVAPWYANFIAVASQIGLTKNANKLGAAETPATRACIAQLLYDALEIDLVESGEKTDKTILSDYLGYIKNTGVISSNDITSLTAADVNLRDNEIQITAVEEGSTTESTYTYSTTDLTLKNYLGYEVEFYYKSDGSDIRTLMFCVVNQTEPVTVNAANIEESTSTNSQIRYYKDINDSKESSLNLESDNVVIFNGKLYGSTAGSSRFDTSMLPEVGSVTLIDSDNNNKYDVISIESYEIYYVSERSTSTYEVIDNVTRDSSNNKIVLDTDSDRNLKIVNASGSEMSFSSISKGNIICFAKSNGSDPISKAIVVTEKVTGTVSAIKGDKITISGKEYNYSKAAPWVSGATSALEEPSTQDSGTYYLDINGDIVAYDKNVSNETIYYGYVLGYSVDKNSFSGDAVFRVKNSAGSEVRIGTSDKTRVNGETCSTGTKVIAALEASAQNQYTGGNQDIQQVIKYTIRTENGNTVFSKIYTASPNAPADIKTDKFNILADSDGTEGTGNLYESMTYNSSSKTLTGNGKSIKLLNTTVFTTPDDDNRTDYDEFAKSSISNTFKDKQTYTVEFFDVDNTNVASVVVVYGADNTRGVDVSSPIYVLTERAGEGMLDGDTMPAMIGYKIVESTMTDFTTSDGDIFSSDSQNVSSLTAGDIFRVGTDKDGLPIFDLTETDYKATEMIYDFDGSNDFGTTIDGTEDDIYRAEYVAILGTVVAKSDSNVVIAPEDLNAGDTQENESDNITFSTDEFSDATVLIYKNTDNKGLEIKKDDYSSAIAGLTAFDGSNTPSKVLIYMSEGHINLLCVFPVK